MIFLNSICEFFKTNGWVTICIPILSLFLSFSLLIFSNQAERLRFTPKQLFKRSIALNLLISIILSMIYGLFVGFPTGANYAQIGNLILFSFIVYTPVIPIVNKIIGLFKGTYHYLIDSNGEKMYIQRKTFDDKVLLSSTPDMYFAEEKGNIRFESSDYLDGKTIHFITKSQYSKEARAAARVAGSANE